MNELNLFALRAASNSDYPVDSSAQEYRIEIKSRKQKIVNGKVTETTTPSCKATIIESWLHYSVVVDSEYNILNFYLTVDKNESGNSRSSTVIIKQDDSGNTINLKVTQEAGISYEYYVVGKPQDGIMVNDPATLVFESHLGSTSNRLILQVLKVGYQGSTVVSQEIVGNTDTFEVTLAKPINDGFRINGSDQGTDELNISTIGGNSGTWFGSMNIRFSYGDIISSNDIELYQR